ncbi:hypothetical protein ACSSS7_000455 [Eimeria intestinalis]
MAESFTVGSGDAGAPSFSLTSGPNKNNPISVQLAKGLPADAWEQVRKNPLFGDWASFFCQEGRLKLERITVQQLKPEICLNVEATNGNGATINGPVVLHPMQASILIVLRNTETYLELCVFCKRPDLSTGLAESLGLIEGHFNAEGKLEGPCAALLEDHLNLTLYRDDCVDLLTAAHGKAVGHAGVLCCPSSTTEADASPGAIRSQLLLYRSTATPEVLQKLEQEVGRTKRHGSPPATVGSAQQGSDLGLSVVYMGDTWRATLDPRAISALFLLVESRYHQVKLPRASRGAVAGGKNGSAQNNGTRRGDNVVGNASSGGVPTKKAAAQFTKISSLTPLCSGVNLRVKVVEPIKPEADLILPRGQVIKRGTMVVGDDEAIITLKYANGQQLELPDVVNTPLLVRNAKVKMEDGHMRLIVDRWGKISDARNDDFKDFNFSVCTAKDMSEQEYELVDLAEFDFDGAEGGTSSRGADNAPPPAGRGGRGPGRGRARTGYRGGRGSRRGGV